MQYLPVAIGAFLGGVLLLVGLAYGGLWAVMVGVGGTRALNGAAGYFYQGLILAGLGTALLVLALRFPLGMLRSNDDG